MKIVIIGAGISGCTAYLALKKHLPRPSPPAEDHSYTIYEAHNTDKDTTCSDRSFADGHSSTLVVGGGLGIGPNGLNVLRRLDEELLRDVVRGGYATAHHYMKNKHGRVLVRMNSQAAQKSRTNGDKKAPLMNLVACSRHSLWRSLRTRIPDEIIVNKRVSEVVANPDGRNLVRFADGSPPIEADLVIGADGVKSTVKRALFPEMTNPYPHHYEGLVGIGGFIPISEDLRKHIDKGSMNFVFGGNGFFGYFYSNSSPSDPNRDSAYHVSEPGDSIAWWSTYSLDEPPADPKAIDREDVTRQLRERHSRWKDPVVKKIIHSGVQIDSVYPTWTSPELPTWERDGVVLVGDAAHALPPTSGQGSSQALEDVEALTLFLAHYLRQAYRAPLATQIQTEKQAIKTAAKQYVALRQPHVKKILDNARRMQDRKRNMSVVEEYIMYAVMWIIGFFPSIMTKSLLAVFEYNIAEEVERILRREQQQEEEGTAKQQQQ
ncbi:hypothetical protein VTN77DRAFT_3532 [Rasamsonia byssochlamydoides]|uniref:uncharacterized protein n=1 Tax=Rasamsonia byssochlamydoides TaxID=89139 RepID=UPI003742FA54